MILDEISAYAPDFGFGEKTGNIVHRASFCAFYWKKIVPNIYNLKKTSVQKLAPKIKCVGGA